MVEYKKTAEYDFITEGGIHYFVAAALLLEGPTLQTDIQQRRPHTKKIFALNSAQW